MSSAYNLPECASCKVFACRSGLKVKIPINCPMKNEPETFKNALLEYGNGFIRNIACNAARVEAEGYCQWTRIEEIIAFSRKTGMKRIGLAYCYGLRREALLFNKIMIKNGFEMASVVCKTGSVPKEKLGLSDEEKIRPDHFEAMCNPVAQASLLNKSATDLNVILGLCVGHDTLFISYSESPVTVLAVKDRVLAHNPLGALYARHYFDKRFN